jgi:hypothetical protein
MNINGDSRVADGGRKLGKRRLTLISENTSAMFGSGPRIENQETTAASSFCRPNFAPGPRDCAGLPLLLQLDPPPGLIWIEAGQLARQRGGVDPEIFSVDDALVVDDEGLNS